MVSSEVSSAPDARGSPPLVAIDQIYGEQIAYMWDFLRYLGVPERDLEDVAHDVFLIAHRRLASYDRARPIRPWLCGIAARVAAGHRRRGYRRREVMSEEIHAVDSAPAADVALSLRRARALLLGALDRLSAERRVVFVLHELEEVPVPEIAVLLDVPLNTVYSRLRRARAQFSAVMRRMQARGGPR